ncbi:hypothetical protein AX16_008633 [Volvariella volvacea WC 439]|nr:hypothetical protein AX16_008633 [Volvariella volvacea WC 439]
MVAHDPSDPLTRLLAPPEDETPEQKAERERNEAAAKKRSDKIDEELKLEQARLKKEANVVRLLLLGQSESGKSTTLKNFRMAYARAAWVQERQSWRSVVQLNLLKSVHIILANLQAEMTASATNSSAGPSGSASSVHSPGTTTPVSNGVSYHVSSSSSSLSQESLSQNDSGSALKDKYQLLKLRLTPLRQIEQDLKKRLGAASEEDDGTDDYSAALVDAASNGGDDGVENGALALAELEAEIEELSPSTPPSKNGSLRRPGRRAQRRTRGGGEFGVRGWRDALESLGSAAKAIQQGKGGKKGQKDEEDKTVDEATDVIAGCRDDIKALWTDPVIKAVLNKRRVKLEDSPGFFLDDLDRIARRDYEPTDDDIVRARLRTLAVQEYRIQFEQNTSTQLLSAVGLGGTQGGEWIIYDVGGSRTMRHAWVPFFDNVNAIIFLAPISCFDETLLEDPRINRLEDSFSLWKDICSSKLLAKATLILFLNKCDLLRRKLKSGVMFKDYLRSYGDRPNDSTTVYKYLRERFKDILKKTSPEARVSYYYGTSVTDVKATANTLKTVRDSILREHLKHADLM